MTFHSPRKRLEAIAIRFSAGNKFVQVHRNRANDTTTWFGSNVYKKTVVEDEIAVISAARTGK